MKNKKGFTLIELLAVIAIIGILSGIILVAIQPTRQRARDVMRKSNLNEIGQFLYSSSCYQPNAGEGDYDLADLIPELQTRYPQLTRFSSMIPKDQKQDLNPR